MGLLHKKTQIFILWFYLFRRTTIDSITYSSEFWAFKTIERRSWNLRSAATDEMRFSVEIGSATLKCNKLATLKCSKQDYWRRASASRSQCIHSTRPWRGRDESPRRCQVAFTPSIIKSTWHEASLGSVLRSWLLANNIDREKMRPRTVL